jgi:multidrug efflux system outer membrane protein
MRKAPLTWLLSAALVFSAPVFGQTTPRVARSTPASAPASTPTSTAGLLTVPAPPPVDDPMLVPVPPPKRMLASWNEAIESLRSRSTDLRIVLDQVLQAEALTRVALAQYLPTITATGLYTHQLITRKGTGPQLNGAQIITTSTEVPIPDALSGNVQLQQDVINVAEFDQIGIDRLNEKASRWSVEDRKRTLALSLANQIVAVVTAERSAEINRVGLQVALEQLEIARRKQALGAATGLDVVRADQNAANARASLVTGDESLHEAREALGLALGIPEEIGVAHDVNIDGLAESAVASCRSVDSVDQRPDIASATVSLEVAKRNLRNVWFTFLPTLTLQSALPTTFVPAPAAAYPNPTWSIQGVLSIPIWDGGARYGNLKNARAAEDIAAEQLESLRRQAIIQVKQAQRQVVVAETSDQVARAQRDLAATNDQMTQTAYMAGQGTSLELVTASEAHRQAELNLALTDFGVVKARILAVLALATCPW